MIRIAMNSRLMFCAMLFAWVATASMAWGADEATQKRREKWLERQKELNLRKILKVDTMIDKGDPSKRVDVVVIGDGYQREDMDKFEGKCGRVGTVFMDKAPFENFANYVNIHRIYLESPKDGFELGTEVERRSRMMSCDYAKAESLARFAPECDIIIVMARTRTAGRSNAAGSTVLLYAGGAIMGTVIHELGHAFGGLADEYVEPDPEIRKTLTVPAMEPMQVNVTLEPVPLLSKWHHWVTPPSDPPVRNLEGALYVSKDVYRPERGCTMRTGGSFCCVCMEQMVRQFFRKIQPIDDQRPARVNQVVCAGEVLPLTALALDYEEPGRKQRTRMDWRWYVNNKPVDPKLSQSAGSTLEINTKVVQPGVYDVVVGGELVDGRVRRDLGLLGDARYWRVEVVDYPRPRITPPDKRDARVGDKIAFEVKLEDLEPGKFQVKTEGLPKNAKFDAATGAFEWTPAEDQSGAYLIDFIASNGLVEQRAQTRIVVQKKGTTNRAPQLVGMEDIEGFEGQSMDFMLVATDEDNDNLLFDIKYGTQGQPEGLKLDRRTGQVTWNPGYTQAAKYYVVVEATDGVKTTTSKIILSVNNQQVPGNAHAKLFAAGNDADYDFCLLLHSENPNARLASVPYLKNTPLAFRTATLVRYLRDEDSEVRKAVLEQVQTLAAGEDKLAFLSTFFREMHGKTWQFTDDDEAMLVMKMLLNDAKTEEWSQNIKTCMASMDTDLKRAQGYNAHRSEMRRRADIERERALADPKAKKLK